eukprot:TRINITY_DN96113_c0_g1_i1.p1 TRINITY_DN96113_c0_g1~~TRINITY_DN96113_c0_g1_i1.p1  ORF type:complete len:128 (-),score=23.42 TRINITY_DN96113_c0_g1_i1:111-494(-)
MWQPARVPLSTPIVAQQRHGRWSSIACFLQGLRRFKDVCSIGLRWRSAVLLSQAWLLIASVIAVVWVLEEQQFGDVVEASATGAASGPVGPCSEERCSHVVRVSYILSMFAAGALVNCSELFKLPLL